MSTAADHFIKERIRIRRLSLFAKTKMQTRFTVDWHDNTNWLTSVTEIVGSDSQKPPKMTWTNFN